MYYKTIFAIALLTCVSLSVFAQKLSIETDPATLIADPNIDETTTIQLQQTLKSLYPDLLPYVKAEQSNNRTFLQKVSTVFPDDKIAVELTDQYMLGSAIMAIPIKPGETSRSAYLPATDWVDYYAGTHIKGGNTLYLKKDFNTVPLYVKAGSIIVLGDIYNDKAGNIELRYYTEEGKFNTTLHDKNGKQYTIKAYGNDMERYLEIPALPYNGTIKIWTLDRPVGLSVNGKATAFMMQGNWINLPLKSGEKLFIKFF